MPAVVLSCGCRVYVKEAHVESSCNDHDHIGHDRYGVVDRLTTQGKDGI